MITHTSKRHGTLLRNLCLFCLLPALFLSSCGRSSVSGNNGESVVELSSSVEPSSAAELSEEITAESETPVSEAALSVSEAETKEPDQAVPVTPQPLTAEVIKEEDRMRTWDFRLGFAGDINFADDYIPVQYLDSIGSADISDGIDQRFIDLMRDMDLMWINNEFAYSDRGAPLDGKAFTFCSSPSHVNWMHDLGVDIVGLANNHTFDYGEEAFLDTLTTLSDAGIPYVGAGQNLEEAMSPVYLQADGFTIAYVAASCAEYTVYTREATDYESGILACYDDTLFLEAIRNAAANADYVIALPHWGTEHSTWLTDKQIYSAQAYLDAGADAVIGAHPHILQGLQFYDDKPILYSLGNFWFDNYDIDTMVAELHFSGQCRPDETPSLMDGDIEVILHPGTQSGVYTAWADTEDWRENIFLLLESISIDVTIDEDGKAHALTYESYENEYEYE